MDRHAGVLKSSQNGIFATISAIVASSLWLLAILDPASPGTVQLQMAPESSWNEWVADLPYSTLITFTVGMIFTTAMTFNLLVKRKAGWGWFSLCVAATILLMVVRFAASIFLEMSTTGDVPYDWDGD